MAEEAQLSDTMTRTVALAGGLQEDVPENLQDYPSMAYVENGRFRKQNEVEKTLPETDLQYVGSQIRFINSTSDNILVGASGGFQEYDGEWRDVDTNSNPASSEKVFSSPQAGGGCHYQWALYDYNGVQKYVIAYETRSHMLNSGEWAGNQKVTIEEYTLAGALLSTVTYSGQCPVVNQVPRGTVVVHYTRGIAQKDLYIYDTFDNSNTSVDWVGGPVRIFAGHAGLDAAFDAASTVDPALKGYNGVRCGYQRQGVNPQFQVYYEGKGASASRGVILYQDPTSKDLKGARLNDDGQFYSAPVTVASPAASFIGAVPLDCFVVGDNPNEDVYFMYATRDTAVLGNVSLISIKRFNSNLLSSDPARVLSGPTEAVFIRGSVTSLGYGLPPVVAFTYINGDETNLDGAKNTRVNTEYGFVSLAGTYTSHYTQQDYAMVSNLVYTVKGPMCVLQQMVMNEPYQTPNSSTDYDTPTIPLALLKPSSSILCNLDATNGVVPIALLDEDTSKHSNASMQEQNPRLGKLRRNEADTNELQYLNRQLLQGEDFEIWMKKSASEGTDNDKDRKISWHPGEYRANFYFIDMIPSSVRSYKFGNAIMVQGALPLWYTGGVISEMSVLDAPEITYLDAEPNTDPDENLQAWSYTGVLDTAPDTWQIAQVVIGYKDNMGHVHRSAPSLPVYFKSLRHPQTIEQFRSVTVTTPITFGAHDYFYEVYINDYGESPRLAATHRAVKDDSNRIFFRDIFISGGTAEHQASRGSEIVYTAENAELSTDVFPSFEHVVVTSRRLFGIKGSNLHYSKLFNENLPPEMNSSLIIPFGQGRKLRAIGKIDDKVIVFEDNTIHAVYGDGPDNTGEGRAFIVDHLQTTVGCSDPESVVEIPEGLLFYAGSTGTFHILTRDLVVQEIGGPVQDLSQGINITAATVFPAESEVRWYATGGPTEEFGPDPDEPPTRPPRPRFTNVLPSGPVFVFNYSFNKWTVLSDQPASDVTIYNKQVARATGTDVFITSEDWTQSNLLKYRLPPLRVQGLQSFGRIRAVTLLGQYLSSWTDSPSGRSAGDIQITCRYDYEEGGLNHVYRWRANSDLNPIYGDRLQFKFKPGKPKCQAIQITVEEVPTEKLDDAEPDYTNGRGFVLSGIDLIYSIKRGLGHKSLGSGRRK